MKMQFRNLQAAVHDPSARADILNIASVESSCSLNPEPDGSFTFVLNCQTLWMAMQIQMLLFYAQNNEVRICEHCGKLMMVSREDRRQRTRKFCDTYCRNEFNYAKRKGASK